MTNANTQEGTIIFVLIHPVGCIRIPDIWFLECLKLKIHRDISVTRSNHQSHRKNRRVKSTKKEKIISSNQKRKWDYMIFGLRLLLVSEFFYIWQHDCRFQRIHELGPLVSAGGSCIWQFLSIYVKFKRIRLRYSTVGVRLLFWDYWIPDFFTSGFRISSR